jgi:cell division protein FtsL
VFVNIIISFVLAIAGFVTLIVLLVKLNRITIYEDTRSEEEKLEERISKIKDVSTNDSIDKNVDDLLRKEGFIDEE